MKDLPSPLIGQVQYHCQVSRHKRKRENDSNSNNAVTCANDDDDALVAFVVVVRPTTVVTKEEKFCHHSYWIISASQRWQTLLSDAARYKATICIRSYTKIPLKLPLGTNGSSNYDTLVEIVDTDDHAVQWHTTTTENEDHTRQSHQDEDALEWSLSQILVREVSDIKHPLLLLPKTTRTSSSGHKEYSFHAYVHSISPILNLQNDPFALLELYDGTTFSCIAVLQVDALLLHAALTPGMGILVRKVQRHKWKVPQLLREQQQLLHPVPSHVFVIQNTSQIDWCKCPPLYDPTWTRLSGTIQSVHTLAGDPQQQIHYLQLVTNNNNNITLFVTYYPMSSALQLSLRPGALVEAIHVQALDCTTYCASLRTTLVLCQTASTTTTSTTTSTNVVLLQDNGHPSTQQLELPQRPCAWRRIRNGYPELMVKQQLVQWLQQQQQQQNHIGQYPSVKVLMKWIVTQCVPLQQQQSVVPRNAYADFFRDLPAAAGGPHKEGLPHFAGLPQIYKCVIQKVRSSLENELPTTTGLYLGWTGSMVLSARMICNMLGGTEKQPVFVGGMADVEVAHGLGVASLVDGTRSWPSSWVCDTVRTPAVLERTFVLAELKSVLVSFVCVGHSPNHSTFVTTPLPPYDGRRSTVEHGPCFIVQCKQLVLLASIHLVCDKALLSGSNSASSSEAASVTASKLGSIEECLSPLASNNDVEAFASVLVRKFFKTSKARNDVFSACKLTLCHVDPTMIGDRRFDDSLTCLQSIDIKPSISTDRFRTHVLQLHFSDMIGPKLTMEQLDLAHAWWKVACCPRISSLLVGGWDECLPHGSAAAKSLRVIVLFPQLTAKRDEKRGYVRFRCQMEELFACAVLSSDRDIPPQGTARIDFMSKLRFLPGMVESRQRRRQAAQRAVGELLQEPANTSGLPSCTIAELHWAMCADLKCQTRYHIAPSLVREIRHASFLGISFCRALPECTKCFHSLKNRRKKDANVEEDGIVTSLVERETSFWDCPLPVDSQYKAYPVSKIRNGEACASKQKTQLRCPSDCSVDLAAIKWECSGTLDDGTGQAKLYAERDTALLLLGLSSPDVEKIEAGAWLNENGVVFSKGVPPKAYLRGAVDTARMMAQEERRKWLPIRNTAIHEDDVLKYLTPSALAEYLMQRHCRRSREALREMSYFVRCKPLSDEIVHLNHTAIEVSMNGSRGETVWVRDAATYSLPPLKLNLVDCLTRQGYQSLLSKRSFPIS